MPWLHNISSLEQDIDSILNILILFIKHVKWTLQATLDFFMVLKCKEKYNFFFNLIKR